MRRLAAAVLVLSGAGPAAAEPGLSAPNPGFTPVNQLVVSGNGCGPAALLNAFGFGNQKWQDIGRSLPGKSDRARLTYVIRAYGIKPSRHLDQLRWTKARGVNLLDLTDMANELRGSRWLPEIKNEVFVLERRESGADLVRRIHARLRRSMTRGLPPVVSLQRLARPGEQPAGVPEWRLVHGHFIVITALPDKLERGATGFAFRYVDPWGGKHREGRLVFDPGARYPAATVSVTGSDVGKRHLRKGEESVITLAAAMGVW